MKLCSIVLAILTVTQVNAAVYDCKAFVNAEAKANFTFDTDIQKNVIAKISENKNAGCILFDSQPKLLSCYIGIEGQSASAVAQIDTPTLAAGMYLQNEHNTVVCVKQ